MKVIIISNSSAGLYLFRRELILRLIKDGHNVVVLTPFNLHTEKLEKLGVRLIETQVDRRGINFIKDLKLFSKYISIIKDEKPELVITYTIKANIYGGIASRLLKIEYAANITGLGTAFEKKMLRVLVVNLYKIALKKAKVVFFENDLNKEKLIAYGCCDKRKAVLLQGAGVNVDTYQYQKYPNNDVFRFLFIGRIMKEKGVEELFEAMSKLNLERGKCILDVLGSYEENYKMRITKYEKDGWLKFHGYQEDVRPYIAKCDCSVLPSYHEGMSNTNLESASCGRPVITSNISGCMEAVVDGLSGYLCEVKNAESLYDAMLKMYELPQNEREKMGIAGRRHVESNFDKNVVVEKTVDALMRNCNS